MVYVALLQELNNILEGSSRVCEWGGEGAVDRQLHAVKYDRLLHFHQLLLSSLI